MILNIFQNLFINTFSILIISTSVCGTGILLNRFFKIGYKLENLFFYGLFIKLILVLFLNLFFSLNIYVNTILAIIGFYFFFKNLKNIKINNNFNFIIFIPLIAAISIRDGFFFDNLLYHIPLINLPIESNLVLGQSNINGRFAIPSLIFSIYSSFYLPILKYYSIFMLNSVFLLFIIKFFIDQNNNGTLILKSIFKILIFFLLIDAFIHPLPIGIFLGRLGSPEYDFLIGLLHIYLVFYVADYIQKNKIEYNFYIIILLALTFFIKPTIFFIFFVFFWLVYLKRKNYFYLLVNYKINYLVLLIFFIVCFVKIFLSTGCLYTYLTFTCADVSWYESEILDDLKASSLSWKGYPTNTSSLMDFTWIAHWFKNYFLGTAFFNYFIILFTIYVLLFFKKIKFVSKNDILENDIWFKIFVFHIISLFLWFFFSPDLRYAWSTLFVIYSYLIFIILKKLNLIGIFLKFSKNINMMLFVLLISLSFKNIHYSNLEDVSNKFNFEDTYKEYINKNSVKINYIHKGNFAHYRLCGFVANPCINNEDIRNKLNFEKKYIFKEYNYK